MNYLLDTNVVCEATARQPEAGVLAWIEAHADDCFLSSVTLGEIWKGLHRLPEGKRKRGLEQWAEALEDDFAEQVPGLETVTRKCWGKFYSKPETRGLQQGCDGWSNRSDRAGASTLRGNAKQGGFSGRLEDL